MVPGVDELLCGEGLVLLGRGARGSGPGGAGCRGEERENAEEAGKNTGKGHRRFLAFAGVEGREAARLQDLYSSLTTVNAGLNRPKREERLARAKGACKRSQPRRFQGGIRGKPPFRPWRPRSNPHD